MTITQGNDHNDRSCAHDVEDLIMPFAHAYGTVVDREYPITRTRVVDLVFDDNTRTAETRHTMYAWDARHACWEIARFVR